MNNNNLKREILINNNPHNNINQFQINNVQNQNKSKKSKRFWLLLFAVCNIFLSLFTLQIIAFDESKYLLKTLKN